jgi:hypothetical protein
MCIAYETGITPNTNASATASVMILLSFFVISILPSKKISTLSDDSHSSDRYFNDSPSTSLLSPVFTEISGFPDAKGGIGPRSSLVTGRIVSQQAGLLTQGSTQQLIFPVTQ